MGDRRSPGQAPGIRLHLTWPPGAAHQQQRLAVRSAVRRLDAGSGARLEHTYGRRLRATGVPLETRRALLGHKNGDIATHYSAPELRELIDAAERVCHDDFGKTSAVTLLKKKAVTG